MSESGIDLGEVIDLDEVRGHDAVRAALAHQLAHGQVAPAYLFAGPEGVGKRATALAFLRAYLCSSSASG